MAVGLYLNISGPEHSLRMQCHLAVICAAFAVIILNQKAFASGWMQIAMSTRNNFHASCDVRAVIRYLCLKWSPVAGIHRELCLVSGPTVLSEIKVGQWCRGFKKMAAPIRVMSGMSPYSDRRNSWTSKLKTDEMMGDWRLVLWLINFSKFDAPWSTRMSQKKIGYHELCARYIHQNQKCLSKLNTRST